MPARPSVWASILLALILPALSGCGAGGTPDAEEIVGEERTFQDVILTGPLHISDSTVIFQGVGYWDPNDDSPSGDPLLHITGSTVRFKAPYPDVPASLWGSEMVVIEDSTIVFEDLQPATLTGEYRWPFSLARNSTLVYEGFQFAEDEPHAFNGFGPPEEILLGRNTVVFRDSSVPGYLEGENLDFVLENWTGYDLTISNDNTLRLSDSTVGDLRAYDNAELTLERVTTTDTQNYRENTSVTIVDSSLEHELRLFGTARLTMRDSSLLTALFYGESEARIEGIRASDTGGASQLLITVGGEAKLDVIGGVMPQTAGEEALIVGDRAQVLLQGIEGLNGTQRFYGDARVTIADTTVSDDRSYEIFLTDRARLTLKDSSLDVVYLQDEAVLTLENSTVRRLYYDAVVEGQASMEGAKLTGAVVVNRSNADDDSVIQERQPLITVLAGGSLTAKNATIRRLTVEGTASVSASIIGELWVTGRSASASVSGGTVYRHFFSLHSDGPNGLIRDGEGVDGVKTVEAQLLNGAEAADTILGLITVTGNDGLEIRDTQVEEVRIDGRASVTLDRVDFLRLEAGDEAVVEIRNSADSNREALYRGYVLSQAFPGTVEASGDSAITMEDTGVRFNVEVFDRATLTATNTMMDTVLAYDNATVTLEGGSTHNQLFFGDSRVTLIGSRNAWDTYVLDSARVTMVCGATQDLFFGHRTEPRADGIFWLLDSFGIVSGGCMPEDSRYPLSGIVPLVAYPQVGNPVLEDASLSAYGVKGFEILVDGQPSDSMKPLDDRFDWIYDPRQEPFIGFGWDTTRVENGFHEITLIVQGTEGEERRWSTVLQVEN